MYKNNSRDSCKFRGFSPLQLHRKLKVWSSTIGYYSYTKRCHTFEKSNNLTLKLNEKGYSLILILKKRMKMLVSDNQTN